MQLALILSGGAARGAFHLGVLKYFEEQNIKISAYSGTSIGSIISVSHASGISAKEQLKIFKSKELKSCIKFNPYLNGFFKIDENNPIINDLLPINKLENIPTKTYISAYDLKNRELIFFDKGDAKKLCIASSAIIPLFRPISYENKKLIDGGLIDNIPIKPFLNKDYNICSVNLFPKPQAPSKNTINPLKLIKRRLFKTWIENANFSINNSNINITSPLLRGYKLFTFNNLDELFNLGYKEAKNYLNLFKK